MPLRHEAFLMPVLALRGCHGTCCEHIMTMSWQNGQILFIKSKGRSYERKRTAGVQALSKGRRAGKR